MIFNIENLIVRPFNKTTDTYVFKEINGNSKSNFIFNVTNRLENSKYYDFFNNAYVIEQFNEIIGYIYISNKKNNNIYIEYLIFKNYRKKGYAYKVLDGLIDYIFNQYSDIEFINLSIDESNIASINLAEKLDFVLDDDSIYLDKLLFIKDNPYFRSKSKK